MQTIALTRTIRQHTGVGLAEGKRCTEQIVERKPVAFKNLSQGVAEAFLEELRALGVNGEIREDT